MSRVIAIEHLTLDGVMQAPGHPEEDLRDGFPHGGWAASRGQDPVMQEMMGARMSSAWSLLAGRTTYERFAEYWPRQEPNPFTEALNRVQKYVASTTLAEPLAWQNSSLLRGDAGDACCSAQAGRGREPGGVRKRGAGPIADGPRPRRRVRPHAPPTGAGSGPPAVPGFRHAPVRLSAGRVRDNGHRGDHGRVSGHLRLILSSASLRHLMLATSCHRVSCIQGASS